MGEPRGHYTHWDYDSAEKIADAAIHVLGVIFALAGGAALLVALAYGRTGAAEYAAAVVYAVSLLVALGASAAYNVWPVTRMKWLLRRFDHSAIYAFIAGTYTPFLAQLKMGFASVSLMIGIWVTAALGMAVKLLLPGRFDRAAVGLYLVLGWSGVMIYEAVIKALPGTALWLLVAGGILYTLGVVFHAWRNLRFQNVIWHGFVLAAAVCHYGAVIDSLVLARPLQA
jgi:hemolysin III